MEQDAPLALEPTVNSELVGKILAFLKERKYESGERLPSERALSERFGVSRNLLREALSTLRALRVIEARPNSGIYLRRMSTETSFETIVLLSEMGAPPTPREIREALEARWPLEMRTVALACERRSQADLDEMAAVLADTHRVLAKGGNICLQDTQFHLALAKSARNEVMTRLLNSFYRLSESRRFALFADVKRGAESASEHQRIYQAVEARDTVVAAELMDKHIGRAGLYWQEILGPDKAQRSDQEEQAQSTYTDSSAERIEAIYQHSTRTSKP